MHVEDKEMLQYLLNALELQLTWPYSDEEKAEMKQERDVLLKLLANYDDDKAGEDSDTKESTGKEE